MNEEEIVKIYEENKKVKNKRVPEDDIKEAIMFARKYLEETDYIVIKLKEYELTNREITDDYSEVFKKREEARETIRNFAQK
ncbi:MAG: hypothetical protein J6C46_08645 [Clostridia bacterium]|nr:hypothetical protein [Clostridia bacterium]